MQGGRLPTHIRFLFENTKKKVHSKDFLLPLHYLETFWQKEES